MGGLFMEELDDFTLIGYIDDVEGVSFYAKEKNMAPGTVKGIQSIHDTLVELAPYIKTEKDVKRLKMEIGTNIDELKAACQKNDERDALAKMRIVRDKVNVLKALLSKQ
jgi:hypothetical protein